MSQNARAWSRTLACSRMPPTEVAAGTQAYRTRRLALRSRPEPHSRPSNADPGAPGQVPPAMSTPNVVACGFGKHVSIPKQCRRRLAQST